MFEADTNVSWSSWFQVSYELFWDYELYRASNVSVSKRKIDNSEIYSPELSIENLYRRNDFIVDGSKDRAESLAFLSKVCNRVKFSLSAALSIC
jgi:hypothetical protein